MAYRSDLAAAHAQIEALRRELRQAKQRIVELEGRALDPETSADEQFRWASVCDAVVSPKGYVYGAGTEQRGGEAAFVVFALDPQLRVRWVVRNLDFSRDAAGLTLTPFDHLLLWEPRQRAVIKIAADTGEVIGELRHRIDLEYANSMTCDEHGQLWVSTYLDGERLQVYDRDGSPRRRGGLLRRLFGTNDAVPGNYINWGWDGALYGVVEDYGDRLVLTKHNSRNEPQDRWPLPLREILGRPWATRSGRPYVLGTDASGWRSLISWGSQGRQQVRSATDAGTHDPLGHETMFLVDPEGGAVMLGAFGSARYVSADGKTVHTTEAHP